MRCKFRFVLFPECIDRLDQPRLRFPDPRLSSSPSLGRMSGIARPAQIGCARVDFFERVQRDHFCGINSSVQGDVIRCHDSSHDIEEDHGDMTELYFSPDVPAFRVIHFRHFSTMRR
ncbi:hypothetical protein WG908_00080 [Sphingobium sp. AN641]|uniref:hypothetical protein n=1 Tax=Sphingobium sp. AN641 TaxID=3133443 RepID=UPI0030C0FBDD